MAMFADGSSTGSSLMYWILNYRKASVGIQYGVQCEIMEQIGDFNSGSKSPDTFVPHLGSILTNAAGY